MSTVDFSLDVTLRTDLGKGASRRLRLTNLVPGIIYGGKEEPTSVSIAHNVLTRKLQDEAFYSHILTINVEGKACKAVLKDLHRHPARDAILHFDLQRVSDNDIIHMHVPIHFVNEESAPGVKAGGQVVHACSNLNVTCQAKSLPEFIEIDMAALEIGDSIHLSEITLPDGVSLAELAHGEGHDQSIVSIKAKGGGLEEETDVDDTAEAETEAPAAE